MQVLQQPPDHRQFPQDSRREGSGRGGAGHQDRLLRLLREGPHRQDHARQHLLHQRYPRGYPPHCRGAHHQGSQGARAALHQPREQGARLRLAPHGLLQEADPHRPAQLRFRGSREHRGEHLPRRLRGSCQVPHRDDPPAGHRRHESLRPPRPWRRRLPHRPEVGTLRQEQR